MHNWFNIKTSISFHLSFMAVEHEQKKATCFFSTSFLHQPPEVTYWTHMLIRETVSKFNSELIFKSLAHQIKNEKFKSDSNKCEKNEKSKKKQRIFFVFFNMKMPELSNYDRKFDVYFHHYVFWWKFHHYFSAQRKKWSLTKLYIEFGTLVTYLLSFLIFSFNSFHFAECVLPLTLIMCNSMFCYTSYSLANENSKHFTGLTHTHTHTHTCMHIQTSVVTTKMLRFFSCNKSLIREVKYRKAFSTFIDSIRPQNVVNARDCECESVCVFECGFLDAKLMFHSKIRAKYQGIEISETNVLLIHSILQTNCNTLVWNIYENEKWLW